MKSTASPRTRTKKFYRIEHSQSRVGPYRHSMNGQIEGRDQYFTAAELVSQKHFSVFTSYHKTPRFDGLGDAIDVFDSNARFGFKNEKTLVKWWSDKEGVYRLLEELGFEVVRYDVTERFDSCRQSVADISDMKNRTVLPFPA